MLTSMVTEEQQTGRLYMALQEAGRIMGVGRVEGNREQGNRQTEPQLLWWLCLPVAARPR